MMAAPEPTSIGEALAVACDALRRAGSPSPRLDAELLLAHVIGSDRTWLLAHPRAPIRSPEAAAAFASLVARRAGGEPVAYLRGFKEWRSLRLRTDARALVPRPETELLTDAAIDEIDRRLAGGPVTAWDVGTGSGAVAVALALRFAADLAGGTLRLVASDVSPEALKLAAENLAAHGVTGHVEIVRADLLPEAGGASPPPDVVVANLPYVPSAEIDAGAGSLAHEPRLALDGGADGLDLVRRFLAEAPGRIAPGATLLVEIGAGQAEAVRALAPAGASVLVLTDLAGTGRVVRIGLAD